MSSEHQAIDEQPEVPQLTPGPTTKPLPQAFNRARLDALVTSSGVTLIGDVPASVTRNSIIDFECVDCKENASKNFRLIVENGGFRCKPCSRKFGAVKSKATLQEMYGVDNVSQLAEVKQKKRETCMTSLGVENPMQNQEVKTKGLAVKRANMKADAGDEEPQLRPAKRRTKIYVESHENELQTQVKDMQITDETKPVKQVFDSKFLQQQIEAAKVTITSEIPPNVTRDTPIGYCCLQCSQQVTKLFRSIVEWGGFYCTPCAKKLANGKREETLKEKHGVTNVSQLQEVKDKKEETCMQNYGVSSPCKSAVLMEKAKATNLERYGVEYSVQNEQVKAKARLTNLERYGVEHVMQNPAIAERNSKNAFKSHPVITPSGNTIMLQGYEPHAYSILAKIYFEEQIIHERSRVPAIFWVDSQNVTHRYYCDFWIPHINLLIEVKSLRTLNMDKHQEKHEKCSEVIPAAGYNYEIWVLDHHGNILQKHIFYAQRQE
jgi:hypothetical protein